MITVAAIILGSILALVVLYLVAWHLNDAERGMPDNPYEEEGER